jgi:hypothetical protein
MRKGGKPSDPESTTLPFFLSLDLISPPSTRSHHSDNASLYLLPGLVFDSAVTMSATKAQSQKIFEKLKTKPANKVCAQPLRTRLRKKLTW